MRWFRRHPGEPVLNRFADGELGEQEHARVASHLATCPRCREEVAVTRRLADVTRSLPTPIATDEVLRRALARRAAGERVLLPMSDAGAPSRPGTRRFAPAAVAAMLTLMVASLVVSVRVLEADRPGLRVHPARPAAGEALRMEYHGGSLFADESHLALRARYRTAGEAHWQLLAGILVRGDDGRFRTEVQLPDSVVYAAFAIEDLQGQRLDSNNRQLWDVMVHEGGKPTLDALTARLRDLESRDWGEAYDVAREMTELYPDAPQSWAIRFSFELSLFDQDSVLAVHQDRFRALERRLAANGGRSGSQLAWLGLYALDLGETGSAETWIREAAARDPYAPATVQARSMLWSRQGLTRPDEVLREVEAFWATLPYPSVPLANLAWQLTVAAGDAEGARVWFARYLELRPEQMAALAPQAYAMSDENPEIARWIENQVKDGQLQPSRALERTPMEHERIDAARRQRLYATLTREAARRGGNDQAARFARSGIPLAWESDALLEFASALLAVGAHAPAAEALARAAADPRTTATASDLARSLPPNLLEAWREQSREMEASLLEHVLDGSIVRYVDSELELRTPNGTVALEQLRDPEGTVLVFLSRLCAPALDELDRIRALAAEVEAMDASLAIIDIDNDPEMAGFARAAGISAPVYRDPAGKARIAFQNSATPDYYVVDASGRIRFEPIAPEYVARQLWALRVQRSAAMATAN